MNIPEVCFSSVVPVSAPEDLIRRRETVDKITDFALKMQAKFGYKLTMEQCREAVYGVLGAIPSAIPPSDPTLYEYNLEHLVAFAIACRMAGVDEGDLKTFANNLDFAFQIASKELRRQQMEAAAKTMGGEHVNEP